MPTTLAASPNVPLRRFPLSEELHAKQTSNERRNYIVERGERIAVAADHPKRRNELTRVSLWRVDNLGRIHRPGAVFEEPVLEWPRKIRFALAKLFPDADIHRKWAMLTYGHDIHVTTRANLYASHWHRGWVNPYTLEPEAPIDETFASFPDDRRNELVNAYGFVEDLGWLRGKKVTDIFVSEEIDELVSATASEYADFDQHRVGTNAQVENNNDTDLITTSGIAAVAGTPTDVDPIYRNVGTITADTTETWEEHVLGNNITSPAIMDRSLTGGQSVNSSDQVQYTYELTKNPEA